MTVTHQFDETGGMDKLVVRLDFVDSWGPFGKAAEKMQGEKHSTAAELNVEDHEIPVRNDVEDLVSHDDVGQAYEGGSYSASPSYPFWSKGVAAMAPEFSAVEAILKHTGRTGLSTYNLKQLHKEWLWHHHGAQHQAQAARARSKYRLQQAIPLHPN